MKSENENTDIDLIPENGIDVFDAFYEVPKLNEKNTIEHSNFSDLISENNSAFDAQFGIENSDFNFYSQEDSKDEKEDQVNLDTYFSDFSSEDFFVVNHSNDEVKLDIGQDILIDSQNFYSSIGESDYFSQSNDSDSLIKPFENELTGFIFHTNQIPESPINEEIVTEDVSDVLETLESEIPSDDVKAEGVLELPDSIIQIPESPINEEIVTEELSDVTETLESEIPSDDVKAEEVLELPDSIIQIPDSPINEEIVTEELSDVLETLESEIPSDEVKVEEVLELPDSIIQIPDSPINDEIVTEELSDVLETLESEIPSDDVKAEEVLEISEKADQISEVTNYTISDDISVLLDTNTVDEKTEDAIFDEKNKYLIDSKSYDYKLNRIVISEELIELLQSNTTIILPKFGALSLIDSYSLIIHFIPYLTYNDSKIAEYLSNKYEIDKQKVEDWLIDFIDLLINDLNNYNVCKINGIGTFTKNNEVISFDQDLKVNSETQVQDEKEIIFEEVKNEQQLLELENDLVVNTPKLNSKNKFLKLSLYIAAIFMIVLTFIYLNNNRLKSTSQKQHSISKNLEKKESPSLVKSNLKENRKDDLKIVSSKKPEAIKTKQNPKISVNDLSNKKSNKSVKTIEKKLTVSSNSTVKKDVKVESDLKKMKNETKPKNSKTVTKLNLNNTTNNDDKISKKNTMKVRNRIKSSPIVENEKTSKESYDQQLDLLNIMIETGYYEVNEQDGLVKLKRK